MIRAIEMNLTMGISPTKCFVQVYQEEERILVKATLVDQFLHMMAELHKLVLYPGDEDAPGRISQVFTLAYHPLKVGSRVLFAPMMSILLSTNLIFAVAVEATHPLVLDHLPKHQHLALWIVRTTVELAHRHEFLRQHQPPVSEAAVMVQLNSV